MRTIASARAAIVIRRRLRQQQEESKLGFFGRTRFRVEQKEGGAGFTDARCEKGRCAHCGFWQRQEENAELGHDCIQSCRDCGRCTGGSGGGRCRSS